MIEPLFYQFFFNGAIELCNLYMIKCLRETHN